MQPASAALAISGRDPGVAGAAAPRVGAPVVRFADAAEAVDALAPEWRELAAHAAEPNPFAEHWFVAASLRHLAPADIWLADVRDCGVLIGLVPLSIENSYGRVPVRHVQNWRHHHLFLGAPLIRRGREEEFWTAVVAALDAAAWAPGFLHLRDLAEDGAAFRGLAAAAAALNRPLAIVHREARAFLASNLTAQAYYEQAVRKKKRKEIGRLSKRLHELGAVSCRRIGDDANEAEIGAWCDAFLALERAGWKGKAGSALDCAPETEAFFRAAVAGAAMAGRLQMLRLDLDERPIAMLVNFLTPPGSFSFKTAFDEDYARFSPGVMIQIENLKILERPDIAWMDSCAAEDHPMIDSFWRERREIVRVTIPLKGARRRLVHGFARTLERASAARRRLSARGTPISAPHGDSE
jgi:CelD/BcsL family acetyltransferase involved in cellulose biosynthesis